MLASATEGAGAAKAALLSRSTYNPSERWAASFLARLHSSGEDSAEGTWFSRRYGMWDARGASGQETTAWAAQTPRL